MMRAASYARFSTENQREASIEDQQRECSRLAARHGFTVVATFADAAISGGTAQRPGYQSLLSAAREGAFDVVIAEDVSRLWRNLAEQASRLAELADLGLYVVTLDLDTRQEQADILAAVTGAMAAHYRKEISRRTRRGMEGRALAGKSTGGACYGYDGLHTIHPRQAAVVRRIFEQRAAGSLLQQIATGLNREQIPAPRGGRWRTSTIHCILRNPRYTGAMSWGRTQVRLSAQDSQRSVRVTRPDGPLVQRQVTAMQIIPTELWAASQN